MVFHGLGQYRSLDTGDGGFRGGPRRRKVAGMAGQRSFAEEGAAPEHADDPFLALLGDHAQLDLALLYVEDRVARGALLEDVALCLVGHDGAACTHGGEEGFRVEGLAWRFPSSPFPGHGASELGDSGLRNSGPWVRFVACRHAVLLRR
jgi:hypothetical protein